MTLVSASISPHPPIIIPEIGGTETKKVKKTITALRKLGQEINQTEPDVLIVISPHGLIYPDRMNVCGMPKLKGDFTQFGQPSLTFKLKNDLELAHDIDETANKEEIETLLYDNGDPDGKFELDHGNMVPLHYILRELDSFPKILPITYSYQDRLQHFSFGQVIADIAQKSRERIGIIASGDLSHRLIPQAPAGYSPIGKKFDQKLIKLISQNKVKEILKLDETFIEEAGECGFRSILILLGAINKLNYQPEIISYEGPFGVGYLVANFNIKS